MQHFYLPCFVRKHFCNSFKWLWVLDGNSNLNTAIQWYWRQYNISFKVHGGFLTTILCHIALPNFFIPCNNTWGQKLQHCFTTVYYSFWVGKKGWWWRIVSTRKQTHRVNGYVFRTVSNYNALSFNLKQCDFNQFKDLNFRLLMSEQQKSYIN
jgi:hypothetical protein